MNFIQIKLLVLTVSLLLAIASSFAPPVQRTNNHYRISAKLGSAGVDSVEDLWDLEDDNGDDETIEEEDETDLQDVPSGKKMSSSGTGKKSKKLDTNVHVEESQSNQTVGVGRHGYNITTLHNVQYEIKQYFPANEKITYQIRLDLLRDYYMLNGDVNVPFRYTCKTFDYGLDKKQKEEYEIALGRWLHNLRKRYQSDPNKISDEFKQQLDGMDMNWEGVGAGRRPTAFRNRCEELKAFVHKNGHDRVPLDGEEKSLGMWVERQRVLYRKFLEGGDCGKQLTQERVDMLREAGFGLDELVDKSGGGRFSARQIIFDKKWKEMYERLKLYRNENGSFDLRTALEESSDNGALLCWVPEQIHEHDLVREAYFSGAINLKSILTPDRFQALAEIGFEFQLGSSMPSPWIDVAKHDFDAESMINALTRHFEQSQDSSLTLDYVYTHDNIGKMLKLYTFQQRLRWEHRHESLRNLVDDSDWLLEREDLDIAEKLNSLGFSWDDDSKTSKTSAIHEEYEWWEMYHDLNRYRKANGNFDVRFDGLWFSEELSDWLEEQTLKFSEVMEASSSLEGNQLDNFMPEWHYRALRSIGFELNSDEILEPKSIGRTPSVLTLEGNLANEISHLPQDLKDAVGGGKRVDKAEELAWLIRYASLRRYILRDGPGALSNVSSDDVGGQRLALWANNQRKQYSNFINGKKSTLTKKRVGMLNNINFDWNLQKPGGEEEWEKMKQDLIEFKEKYGHCFVPAAYPLNQKLGQWVLLQRQLYQQSRRTDGRSGRVLPSALPKKKIDALLKIGLDLTMDNLSFGNMTYETMWMCRLEELANFKDVHGHCNVPIDYESPYYHLGVWVREQRILFARGKEGIASQLDKRRMDDLEQIGFQWEIEEANDAY